jgi:uncharacterized protein (TIGR03435 family)
LKEPIAFAYDVSDFQISGGAGWLDSDRFDIFAKPPTRTPGNQVRQMVQALLADRFRLAIHHTTNTSGVACLKR